MTRFEPAAIVLSAILLALTCPPAHAQSEAFATRVAAAAQDDRPSLLRAIVVQEIARQPSRTEAIVAQAIRAAPASEALIVDAATDAFPAFAMRIDKAARTAGGASAGGTGEDADASPWTGEFSLGGSRNSGNSETTDANASATATYTSERWEHELNAEFSYSSDRGRTTGQRWLANYQPRYNITERLYGFGFAQYEDDRFSGFDYQVSENAGLGYRLVLPPPVSLAVEVGPGARHSRVSATGETQNEVTARGAVKFAWQISETAKFTNDLSTTVGRERTLTRNVTALTTDLMASLKARLSFELRNNSNPPAGRKKTDTVTKGSLVYTF